MKKMGLHELISLTFDSDPKVRKQAALELSKYDAPGAMFALVELTYDKDSGVQEVARGLLDKLKEKNREPELMSFADVFSKGESGTGKGREEPAAEAKAKEDTTREKMLRPIEKMFEKKLGKEKAEEMKKRMMPTIEKMYEKAADVQKGEKKSHGEKGKTVHDMLEEYLDVIAHAQEKGEPEESGQKSLAEELGLVGGREIEASKVLAEAEEGAIADEAAVDEGPSAQGEWENAGAIQASAEPTMFKLAFDSMMASRGDAKIMKETMKKLLKSTEEQIKLAFKVAKKRYSEINVTNITELKNGMRNITTGALYAKSVEHKDYQRTKTKKDTMTRIVVADQGGNEGVIYLFDERGRNIKPGMKLKVEKGYAKTYDWSGETAMTVSKKGKVFIIV
jgi:hypothetical protein